MNHERARAARTAVVLDPHPLCHTAIAGLLARFDIDVVGATTSPGSAVALLEEHRPDLLVAELDLAEGSEEGLRVLSRGRESDQNLAIVVLSSTDDTVLIDAAFERGASAYVLKTSEPEVIATAVRQAFEPSLYFARPHGERNGKAVAELMPPKLTRRELEILRLVSEGRSNRQVAELLWVTDQTVKFHLANVYRKLGVRSRFEAARWALEHGVLEVAAAEETLVPAQSHANGNTNVVSLRRPSRPPVAPRGQLEETSR
jgi:DNA-binding NarL/FixJ family response regulator